MGSVLEARRATYPRTYAAFRQARNHATTDRALEFGLERILDGLARFAARDR
jgi:hypothetical protein